MLRVPPQEARLPHREASALAGLPVPVLASASILHLSSITACPVEQDIQLDCPGPNPGGASGDFSDSSYLSSVHLLFANMNHRYRTPRMKAAVVVNKIK
jgi:hypothetical protein